MYEAASMTLSTFGGKAGIEVANAAATEKLTRTKDWSVSVVQSVKNSRKMPLFIYVSLHLDPRTKRRKVVHTKFSMEEFVLSRTSAVSRM
jgi:hypothetical protein